ncbi:MAG TPA: exonuclease [Dehalococcoidia bacterium]|jgi:ribonuclease J|nr:exonuclease [Dehalococcoidia bacterium]
MQITVYDGADTIGGNKVLLEDGGVNLFFDFGINFHLRNQYFEEYLVPRSRRGLLDMFHVGLLPPLRGIYREDSAPSDIDVWSRIRLPYPVREIELHGVLLSHAHLDHSGHISFLRQDIPVITSLCTAYIAKAIQDSSKSDFEKEVCYLIPKVESEDGLLQSGDWRKCPAEQRPFGICDCDPTSRKTGFWQALPGARGITPCGLKKTQAVEGLAIKAFPVDHSIFGATAFAVETSQGWVVYTGDIRLHGKHGYLTRAFAEAVRALHPLALICEGTHVDAKEAVDETTVHQRAMEVVQKHQTLVVADFGPRHLERLLTFRDIAKDCGRRLVVTSRDIYLLEAAALATDLITSPEQDETILLYKEPRRLERWEEDIHTRYAGRCVVPAELKRNGADYILCFSFWDISELIEIDPEPGAVYIYSSSEAFDEEQRFDIARLRNWLNLFGMQPVGVPDMRTGKPHGRERGFHASGHITGPDLMELIGTINPEVVIPVHTENHEFFRQNIPPHKLRLPTRGVPIVL